MNRIPYEILNEICLYLHEAESPYGPHTDLSSLSQVNRFFYQVAVPILYQDLTIKFWDEKSLQAAVSEVTEPESPQGRRFRKYTRRLYIVGIRIYPCLGVREKNLQWQLEPWAINFRINAATQAATRESFLGHWMTACRPCPDFYFDRLYDRLCWYGSWAPVEYLIACLEHLDQLHFVMETNFTSGLKQAILHHHPNCRVMIPGNQVVEFSILDSEYQAWAEDYYEYVYTIYEHNLDFDIDILQLPALHQLNVGFMQNDSTPYENLEEVLSYIVTSPGLKHLSLDHHFDVLEFPLGKLKEKWHDFVVAHPSKQTSQLESLRILGRGLGEGIIFKFAATGSLSNLHTLELFSDDPENLAKVGQLLPSLEKLLIQIRVKSTHDEGYIKFATAIRAFHPVKYLSLHYFPWVEGLHQIVKHHGVSLKGLILHFPYLGHHPKHAEPKASDIDRLALDCPNLEELRLEVPRSLGNQSECDIYKAFGRFSKLRSLFLGLNFDRRMDRRGPCNDTQEVELHLKTFMNAATDEKLALGIWHLVNIEAPCLQYLRIFPFAHEFSWGEECLLKYLTHSYLITRYNFQNPESPYIEEIGKRLWEVEREGDGWAQNDYYHLCEEISQLPRKIWPPVPGKGDWRDCWSSFPLQPEGKAVETLHMPSSLL